MQRRRLLLLISLVPAGHLLSRYLKALAAPKPQTLVDYREQALRLNQLAGGIQTVADAREFVDFVAGIFSRDLLPALFSRRMRERIVEAEFAAATDPHKLIPEERIAEAWNTYVQTIGAPLDRRVTTAEVHNLRDSFFSTANLSWARGEHTIWTVPAIYATRDGGAMAEGCRAMESIRIFWDLANMPENLLSARTRVRQGVLVSDLLRQVQESPSMGTRGSSVLFSITSSNPVEVAEREYIAKNGIRALGKAVNVMLDDALI